MAERQLEQYEELNIMDKLDYYMNHSPFEADKDSFNGKVHCIHCDKEFIFNEFKVVKDKYSGMEYIVCKHFPDCDGSIMDFM